MYNEKDESFSGLKEVRKKSFFVDLCGCGCRVHECASSVDRFFFLSSLLFYKYGYDYAIPAGFDCQMPVIGKNCVSC
jgi:hypothetical protein